MRAVPPASAPIHVQAQSNALRLLCAAAASASLIALLGWMIRAGVVLGSPAPEPTGLTVMLERVTQPEWTVFGTRDVGTATRLAFYWIGSLAASVAALLSILLVWRGTGSEAARVLSVSFAALALWYALSFVLLPFGLPVAGLPAQGNSAAAVPLAALACTAFGIGSIGLLRFAAVFPRPLTATDLESYTQHTNRQSASAYQVLKLRFVNAYGVVTLPLRRRVPVLQRGFLRMQRGYAPEDLPQLSRLLSFLQSNGAWLALVAPALLLLTWHVARGWPAFNQFSMLQYSFYSITIIMIPLVAYVLLKVGHHVGDAAQQRSTQWISGAFWMAMLLLAVIGMAPFLAAPVLGQAGFGLYVYALALLPPLTALVITGGIATAVLYHGAVEPQLIVRRSTVYALLGVLLTGAFVALEGAISSQVVVRFGLPSQSGAVAAGSVVAVLLGPVRRRVEMATDGIVTRLMPVTALATGARRDAVVMLRPRQCTLKKR
jgi:hypothetical protein